MDTHLSYYCMLMLLLLLWCGACYVVVGDGGVVDDVVDRSIVGIVGVKIGEGMIILLTGVVLVLAVFMVAPWLAFVVVVPALVVLSVFLHTFRIRTLYVYFNVYFMCTL